MVVMKAMKVASAAKKKPAAAPSATRKAASASASASASKGPMLKEYGAIGSQLGDDRSSMTKSDKVALLDTTVRAYKECDGKGISFSQPEMRCL